MIDHLPRTHRAAAADLWHATGLTRPWNDPAADLDRVLTGPSSTVLADLADGSLRGTVMFGHDGHRGWMYYLAVDPAHRGLGIGAALVRAAERWLEARGIPKAMLMVRGSNAAVVDFYERFGYVDQGTVVLGRFFDDDLAQLRGGATAEGRA